MFTYNLSILPANLLNSLHFLDECCLFSTTKPESYYTSLTQNSAQPYTLAFNPTKTSSRLPESNKHHLKEIQHHSFISGWVGVIDYPGKHTTSYRFLHFNFSILIDTSNTFCTLQSYTPLAHAEVLTITSELTDAISTNEVDKNTSNQRIWHQEWNKDQYTMAFNKVKQYLLEGDSYQINLAMPFICHDDLTQSSPINLLEKFNGKHACYIKTKDRTIFSVSPERLVRIENDKLITSPIKGTAPRSKNESLDKQSATALISSSKNQSENLMIVDLLRNDLSVHALPHSVKVEKLYELESHFNVHHLVSTITATLSPEATPAAALHDIFPGGSITGAPKIRAMEIIEELEAQPRGAYCGSFGYIDDSGLCDFNILIRTIEAKKTGATCWGGGGIVIDSEVDSEYEEIFNKIGEILTTPL